MELLEAGEIVELDSNKEFIVIKEVTLDGFSYLYLVSNFKPLEVMFAKQQIVDDQLQLTVIGNQEEKIRLLQIFTENMEP